MTISANFPQIAPSLDLDFANSVALDPRISYSRSTTGTYYDGQTSALAEQNLITYSQGIGGTGWTNNFVTPTLNTTNVTDPLNGNTATQVVETIDNNTHFVNNTSSPSTIGIAKTISVYAKAGTLATPATVIQIASSLTSSLGYANFNLATGLIGTYGSQVVGTPTMTQIGSTGWYRCVVTVLPTSSATNVNAYVALTQNNASATYLPSYVGLVTTDVYLWGAQIDTRSSAYPYFATTTTSITNYIPQLLTAPVNQPRFDFNPTTRQSLGLLMEQQSTNILTYSSDYTQSVWTNVGSIGIATAQNIAPDGTLTANKLTTVNGTTSVQYVSALPTVSTSSVYTFSAYVKSNGWRYVQLGTNSNWGLNWVNFDLSTPQYTIGGGVTSASITSVGNGWYRIIATLPTSTNTNGVVFVAFTSSLVGGRGGAITGDGTGIYLWGAQLEATAFPTSYIPTGASQVTRAQDFATMSGTNFSSWFNNQQGTVYCSCDVANLTSQAIMWGIDNNSSSGYAQKQNAQYMQFIVTNALFNFNTTISAINTTYQFISSYNNISGSQLYQASGQGATTQVGVIDSTHAVPLSYLPTQLSLGKAQANASPMTGHIRKFAYYPISTTATQLQSLTGS